MEKQREKAARRMQRKLEPKVQSALDIDSTASEFNSTETETAAENG